MEDTGGTAYALQIALETLRERCQQYQQRVANLEQENSNLKSKIELQDSIRNDSLTEIDRLKEQISQLREQNSQLANNYHMVSVENRGLWSRLSNVTQANANLGSKLNKINESLSQHNPSNVTQNIHSPLIRSKTFTQDEPRTKFSKTALTDENEKISLELEDISLKLMSTIAQEKLELESQHSQINESNTMFINSFAFAYIGDSIEITLLDEFNEKVDKLKSIKDVLLQQQDTLTSQYDVLKCVKVEINAASPKEQQSKTNSVSIQAVMDELQIPSENSSLTETSGHENDKICPMCNKVFSNAIKFNDFQNHVESHFIAEPENGFNC